MIPISDVPSGMPNKQDMIVMAYVAGEAKDMGAEVKRLHDSFRIFPNAFDAIGKEVDMQEISRLVSGNSTNEDEMEFKKALQKLNSIFRGLEPSGKQKKVK